MTGPIQVDMRYTDGTVRETAEQLPASSNCVVTINKINDARGNKDTLGSVGAEAVYGDEIEAWVRSGLVDLRSFGYRIESADTMLPQVVRMDVSLRQAYVRSVNTSIESIVRLKVRYQYAGHSTTERSYRGGYVKVNWASASNEVMDTLNHAMGSAVRDIAKDLPALCGI